MPKPRILQKYEVDESRCILCGICVDACPYDALRDGADIELAHIEPREPDDRPDGHRCDRPARPRSRTSGANATGPRGPRRRAGWWTPPGCCRSCRPASSGSAATATGNAAATATGTARDRARPRDRAWRGRRPGPGQARVASARMRHRILPVILALGVMGAVLGIAALMLVFLGQDWADALFWILAAIMIGAGLLVVTMRDIIRCGLAMIVCFGALAGIYVLIGAPLIGAAQVIVYIGAISVLILFAIMLTQTKDAPEPARLPDPGRAGGDRVRGHRGGHRAGHLVHGLAGDGEAGTAGHGQDARPSCSATSCSRSRSSACSCWRPSSAASSWPSASPGARHE
ncbi:MAG: NADH-quinone oxidoreductase subunit J [Candidatus Limnocylindrales bacterium]